VQAYTPARLFTLDEANGLILQISGIFQRMDPKLARLRELQDLAEDAEMYWGSEGETMPLPERERHVQLVTEAADVRASLDLDLKEIHGLGCEVKDVASGLVDFPAAVEGNLAYLCWQRGEGTIANWHTLEGGFAGRKLLRPPPEAER
jgi:hypothetical protein